MFLLLALLPLLALSTSYTRITNYNQYLEEWHKLVPEEHIHDVSHLALRNQLCYGEKCKFEYYQHFSKGRVEKDRNRTVLLVAGMHGNQYLGPHTLLYGYSHFEAAHIVYFPVANPSGFASNQRETQPTMLDTNRDFPVDNNRECYQTNAAFILDFLFRQYKFDLTIILHDGSTEIGFNWGTFAQLDNSHTEDYEIQQAIGQLFLQSAGKSKDLTQFKMGTMDEVIYAAKGSLDDWAYSIGRYPEILTESCIDYQFQPYPEGSASDLVFLLELGPKQSTKLGSQAAVFNTNQIQYAPDGYVSRGIRMVRDGLKVVSPTIQFSRRKKDVKITVEGCLSALITAIDIVEVQKDSDTKESKYLLTIDDPFAIEGNCRPEPPKSTLISLDKLPNTTSNSEINYRGTFECGMQWVEKGKTSFAKIRKYRFDLFEQQNQSPLVKSSDDRNFIIKWISELTLEDYLWIGTVIICILALMSAIFAVLQCLLRPKGVKHHEKLEHETVEEIEGGEDLHTARGGIIEENM